MQIGFVPTMGHLHEGHISLIKESQKQNDVTVVSIFVNPTQFNQQEDFTCYPRTLEEDLSLLTKNSVNYCFIPSAEELYPDHYTFQINNTAPLVMESQFRPNHFAGVLTVVIKLFNIVKPHRAYFGEKDFQQLELIQGMVRSFFLDIEVIACPTKREPGFLALSSRNSRLNKKDKEIAREFAAIFHQKSESLDTIRNQLNQLNIEIEYLVEYKQRRFIAIYLNSIRLIDNYSL